VNGINVTIFMNKKTLYFLRHGQSVYNKLNILQGRIDSPLSDEGEHEAKVIAPKFKKLELGHIAHSPLLRAKQTAMIINEQLNLPISQWQDIQEMSFGDWQHELKYEYWDGFKHDFYEHGAPPPGGESRNQVYRRVEKEVHNICKNVNESSILVACHGMVIRIILGEWFTNATEKGFRSIKVPNLGVFKVEVEYDETRINPISYKGINLSS
jgi:broad specificity phosphatase PhoE